MEPFVKPKIDIEAAEKIEIIELDLINSKDYLKNVVYPYFIDIFNDLSKRSDIPEKGVDKVTMLEYSNLPGMVGERFFHLFDDDKDGYVNKKEFVKGFSRIFSSHLDTSLRLIFEFYDFDEDYLINKEDIRIILSYVPIWEMANKERKKEGKYTSGLGAETSFSDRQEAQEEIQVLLDKMFENKDKLDYNDFKKFNQEVTSEALLCILNTLRNSLPWTNNFYLYLRNYQKVLEKGSKATTPKESKTMDLSVTPKIKSSPLASPSLGKKFLATSLLVSEKVQKKDLGKSLITTKVQNPLLKYALDSNHYEEIKSKEETKAKIEGAGLKSALQANEAKSKRLMEIAKLQEDFNIDYKAVRMPNKKTKINFKATKVIEETKDNLNVIMDANPANNMVMSPSNFLKGSKKIPKEAGKIWIWGRMPVMEGEDSCILCEKKDVKMEGYLLRKAKKKHKLK